MTYLIQSQVTESSVRINSNVFGINFYAFGVTCDGFVVTVLQKAIKQNGSKPQKLTFAKTSGTVARGKRKNLQIADRRVPSNYPRNTCGTYFAPSSFEFLVSKVANWLCMLHPLVW